MSQRQPSLEKVADHVFPREAATLVGVAVGIVIGIGNAMLGLIFPSWLATLGLLLRSRFTDSRRILLAWLTPSPA